MKKIANIVALCTILLGAISPVTTVNATTLSNENEEVLNNEIGNKALGSESSVNTNSLADAANTTATTQNNGNETMMDSSTLSSESSNTTATMTTTDSTTSQSDTQTDTQNSDADAANTRNNEAVAKTTETTQTSESTTKDSTTDSSATDSSTTDSSSKEKSTKTAEELVPDPSLRAMINRDLKEADDYEFTEAELLNVHSLDFNYVKEKVISDWTGLELLTNLEDMSDAGTSSISKDSDFVELISKINQLPKLTYLSFSNTIPEYSVLSNLTSTSLETLELPFDLDGLKTTDLSFLGNILANPNLKTVTLCHTPGGKAGYSTSYKNGIGSDLITLPNLPEGYSFNLNELSEGWQFVDQRLVHDGEISKFSNAEGVLTISGPNADKVKFGSRNLPVNYLRMYFYIDFTSQAAVNTHDSIVYVGDEWKPEDNFISATDINGNPVDFSQITVEYDPFTTEKPAERHVKYIYGDITSYVTVSVIAKRTAIEVKPLTIYEGDPWTAKDNFVSAVDKAGDPLDFSEISVDDSEVDTNKAGTYRIYYSYDNVINKEATLYVFEDQSEIRVEDLSIYEGESWTPEDSFLLAKDKDGNPVRFSDITVDASQVDTNTPGEYKVNFSYEGMTSTAILTVKEDQTAVNVHDYDMYVGDTWYANYNFESAFNQAGASISFGQVTVDSSQLDTNTPGTYDVVFTFSSSISTATSVAKVRVHPILTAVEVRNSTIYVGDIWKAEDNFKSAQDKAGKDVPLSAVTVDTSHVDTSKVGTFEVAYTYDGVTSTATVTVEAPKTAIEVENSTIYVGDKWTPKDNFKSAVDKAGNAVDFSEIKVDASQADITKAGSFEVTYSYDGVSSIAKVTVKENKTAIDVKDKTIYVGDKWTAEDNFETAVDRDGKELKFTDLTVDVSQADTAKPGEFEVTYSYDGVSSTAKVTVKENKTAITVKSKTIYVGDKWTAEDNFESAVDRDGKELKFADLTVDTSKADITKAGSFEVTYSYDGVSSTAKVTVKENKTAITVRNKTIYVGDKWTAKDNFESAVDRDGKSVDFSKITVDESQADITKVGAFEVTYSYDGVTSTAKVTVKENKTAITVKNKTIYVGDSWKAEDNFESAVDRDGNELKFADLKVDDSKADITKAGSFEVTYSYDGVTSTAKITVKENKTAITVKNKTIYVGDSWKAEDNFESAVDKDGNELKFTDLTVDTSQADITKAGTFEVTYSYDGVTSTAKVTVKENKTAVKVKDSTIYIGDAWTAKDNFESAVDKDGNAVDFSQITVDGTRADLDTVGIYTVAYSYDGVTSIATITVKENKTAVNVKDKTIYVGDKWTAEDNFESATDKAGNSVDFSKITVDASQADTTKVGTFEVTYSYDGVSSTAKVTVKENKTAIKVKDKTIYVGDAWTAKDNFETAVDKTGKAVGFSKITVDASQADVTKAGSFEVTYSYDGVSSTAKVTVKENKAAVNVKDKTIYVGDKWTAEDNFETAVDKTGKAVDFSKITVDDSQADITKAGTFEVTYSYDNVTSTAKVTVKENKTAITVKDSTIYVGDEWTAEDNFETAVDKAGNAVDFSEITVDASQADTTKVGTFEVTYSYAGVTSTAKVTVEEEHTAIKVHNLTIYVGDEWTAKDDFDWAVDKAGHAVDFSQLTIDDSHADIDEPGTFTVTYTYEDVTSAAVVTVKENLTAINVRDTKLTVGDTWTPADNFVSAVDEAGNAVELDDIIVDASQVNIAKVGVYEVTYSYAGVTSVATVTVEAKDEVAPKPDEPSTDGKDDGKDDGETGGATDNTTKPDDSNKADNSNNSDKTGTADSKNNKKDTVKDNKKKAVLPKTGEENGLFFNLSGYLVLAMASVAWYLRKKVKK
ncbi:hypothetical protein BAU15_00795 [Enterococcus sp. JM4C]|uniref:bacterial Ig-like domain-containing protein n=1 Tax=Candidatus Enterococcus huntleyi TaxID=1857217 RepID=UPI00137B1B71|nr:bacterial Ig-like domain-containing protein [Enterococcus sp. JM4C]KAF1299215.1 hypothetical protein BAU15_00795 [Enterococcus sp. JM4C]